MQIALVHGYYLNDGYVETSRTLVSIDIDASGLDLLQLAKGLDWPDHLQPKLGSLFLEASDRQLVDLEVPLSQQNVHDGTEVRLRLGLR